MSKRLNIDSVPALVGIVGPIVVVVGDIIASLSTPDYSPIRDSISSLALTSIGWLQSICFLAMGLLLEIFVAGIFLSGLNPFFLVWWVTVGSLLLMNFLNAVGTWGLTLFIVVHWLCDLVWLSLVSFTVYRTHSFWGERVQEWVFIALSLALLYFGGYFIVKGIMNYVGAA